MRYAIFSDIHSNYKMFLKGLEDVKDKEIDAYIFLGDYVTDGFDGEKVIQKVKELGGHIIGGNRERYLIQYDESNEKEAYDEYLHLRNIKYSYDSLSKESIEYIKQLQNYKIIRLENKKICMAHSTPYSDSDNIYINGEIDSHEMLDNMIRDFDCDIYLLGHEHISYDKIYKNRYFINPGSIGIPCYEYPLSYGILEIQDNKVCYENKKIEYDYKEIENYYKNTAFYDYAKYWCKLILENFRDGKNHIEDVVLLSEEKKKQRNIENKHIPNDIYEEAFQEYMAKLEVERRKQTNETSSNI